ncbi:telomere length regulator protein [Diplocarpon rosae]|nr:telomere length regulator protein [Diplocarpon rosae]
MVESAAASNPPPIEARPPTPPRESGYKQHKAPFYGLARLYRNDANHRRASAPASGTSAPVEAVHVHTPGSGKSGKKRVLWSESTEYKDPPAASFDGKSITRLVQPLAPSSERKPPKSILKASNGFHEPEPISLGNTKLLPVHHHATFTTMLESVLQQLAGKDRSSKMDAYLMLSSTLKASENVPDPKALRGKMAQLCQFIWQDLSQKLENGKADTGLVVNALILLSSFLQKPAMTDSFPPDFAVQFVDHAIRAIEDELTSKEVLKHLLFIMAQQNFPAKVMNQERVGRLITAAHNVGQVKGKSIAISRISVYRALLRHSKSYMINNAAWIGDMFTDMLSSLKETRSHAIAFGFEAAIALGNEANASRAVINLFKSEAEGVAFADYYSDKLKIMVKQKEDGVSAAVPQIWSIVILFLRSNPETMVKWKFWISYLGVIQLCFNSKDTATKMEANFAWNRLIYAVQPNERSSARLRSLLSQALVTQLNSRKSQRRFTLGTVNILLYYALKPQSPSSQLDLFWDEYVVPFVNACLESTKDREAEVAKQEITDACIILECLFDPTTQRKWLETRAIDSLQHNVMSPAELPALDSKWLRRNFFRVFRVLVPTTEKLYWDLCSSNSPISKLWKTYIASIASPAVKEVEPNANSDSMSCIASIFSMLHKFWNSGVDKIGSLPVANALSSDEKSAAFLKGFEYIASTSISGLGTYPFTRKQLSIVQDSFIAVGTPSHEPKRNRAEMKLTLHHLVLIMASPSPGLVYQRPFCQLIAQTLSPFFLACQSKRSRMEFLKKLFHLLSTESTEQSRAIWQVLADFATTTTDTREEYESSDEQPLGSDYRDISTVLNRGANLSPDAVLPGWKSLFEALVTSITLDAGDAGRAIAVIEPVSTFFTSSGPNQAEPRGLPYFCLVLEKAKYPKDRQALDAASRKLWGVPANQKSSTFDPYVHLYEYIRASLKTANLMHSKNLVIEHADIISAVTNFLGRCPVSFLLPVLARIQSGIECWVLDDEAKLVGGDVLSKAVATMWGMIRTLISRILDQNSHTEVLSVLETLICSGLNSKHMSIVNATIKFWNQSFGSCEEHLAYPESVKEALLKLRTAAELQLPFFPESFDGDSSANQRQPMEFVESQNEFGVPEVSPTTKMLRQTTPQVLIRVGRTTSMKRSRENTPNCDTRKSRKLDTTPRIRHDDSQVQFEAVESSPADRVFDSQLLTDKQKETKERQAAENSMFPDLRSTPIPLEKPAQIESEMELPPHRSSSQIRTRMPEINRETTPTLIIPSDDDGFIASSPTPKRLMRGESAALDPPSSPPETPAKQNVSYRSPHKSPHKIFSPRSSYIVDLTSSPEPSPELEPDNEQDVQLKEAVERFVNADFVSSPPEMIPRNGSEKSIDMDPTVEIDETKLEVSEYERSSIEASGSLSMAASFGLFAKTPLDFPDNTISSVEFTTIEHYSSSAEEDPSDQLRNSQREEELKAAMKVDLSLPQTLPLKSGLANEIVFTRKALIDPRHPVSSAAGRFVDAHSSPLSSDKQVFEDAVSSPHSIDENSKHAQLPSTPADFGNDSSFQRMMEEFDDDSIARRPSTDDFDRRQTRSLSAQSSVIKVPAPTCPRRVSTRKYSSKKTINVKPTADRNLPAQGQMKSSSIHSLIPETPGIKIAEQIPIIGDDALEYNDEDTIIVDTFSLENNQTVAEHARKKLIGRKRKLQEVGYDMNEVPDSQDIEAEMDNSSQLKISPEKKRRGRARRSSQVEQPIPEVESSQDSLSQSTSVDLDTLSTGMKADSTASGGKDDEDTSGQILLGKQYKVDVLNAKNQAWKKTRVVSSPKIETKIGATAKSKNNHRKVPPAPTKEHGIAESSTQSTNRVGVVQQVWHKIAQVVHSRSRSQEEKEVPPTPSKELEIDESFEDSAVTADATEAERQQPVTTEEDVDFETPGADELEPNADVIQRSPIDESILRKFGSPLPVSEDMRLDGSILPVTSSAAGSEDHSFPAPETPAQAPEDPVIPETPLVTAECLASKLQSLLRDLQRASLSRREVDSLEDLFMDAKEQLYKAGRRGRDVNG